MNGVAPVMTVLLGVLALGTVPYVREKAPVAVSASLAWWAIAGVPYLGLQLMTAARPVRLRGDGSDSAAGIGVFLARGLWCEARFRLLEYCFTLLRGSSWVR
jgi:hypothetical protein